MSTRSEREGQIRVEQILDAAEAYDVKRTSEWRKLAELSDETEVDSIRANPDSIIIKGGRFSGIMNIYVLLKVRGADPFEETDAFPARFEGHFEGSRAVIDNAEVSVRSFYAGTGIEPP